MDTHRSKATAAAAAPKSGMLWRNKKMSISYAYIPIDFIQRGKRACHTNINHKRTRIRLVSSRLRFEYFERFRNIKQKQSSQHEKFIDVNRLLLKNILPSNMVHVDCGLWSAFTFVLLWIKIRKSTQVSVNVTRYKARTRGIGKINRHVMLLNSSVL